MKTITIILLAGLLSLTVGVPQSVYAETFTVNSTLDAVDENPGDGTCETSLGNCTLRAAIMEANAKNGADKIKLKKKVYLLSIGSSNEDAAEEGDLDISDDLTITGKGAKKTFVNAQKIDRVFHITEDIKVKFTGLTIQNGHGSVGGGIYNQGGTVIVKNSYISNNTSSSGGGGGIWSDGGTMTIKNTSISANTSFATAGAATLGGGIGIFNGAKLTVNNSSVLNNIVSGTTFFAEGGGIYIQDAKVTISSSMVSGNTARGEGRGLGGGINYRNDTELTITDSTISNNAATGQEESGEGGGIYGFTTLTLMITNSTISGNAATGQEDGFGGGMDCISSTVTVKNSSILNNVASGINDNGRGGGIIQNGGTLTVTNSTISNNFASGRNPGEGGGIWNSGNFTARNSTISNNSASGDDDIGEGGGIWNSDNGTATLRQGTKIIRNFASDNGGGVANFGILDISANSDVSRNIPNDIVP